VSQDSPMILYHGATDVGNIRTNNEDVYHISETYRYCLVADGMGGAAAGEVASQIFADTAKEVFYGHDGRSEEGTIARVQTTFKLANKKILNHVRHHPHDHGMGCTAELLAFFHKGFVIGHVGDSRTYRLKNNILKQLTKDHSVVQEQVDQGLITQQEARRHAMRNVILRAVGVNDAITIDVIKGKKKPGDLFLLCSDGLTDMVEESDILGTLTGGCTLRAKSETLIALAKAAGGKDNVTVVLSAVFG
jgi:serine/threonine protein phosphatase PrpC